MLEENENIIKELCLKNFEFKSLFDEHIQLEQDLEALYSLKYFPPEVERDMKDMKRKKLLGKDKMKKMISEYKSDSI